MVTVVHPTTFMFSRPMAGNGEEYDYPEPPQNHFSAAPITSTYEAAMATDAFQFPRQFGAGQVQFEPETWMSQNFVFDGRQSPATNNYDDANLSSMSAPSPTSTAGSPPSQPGQLAGGSPAEWAPQSGMVVTPGIVGHGEYLAGSDYTSYSTGMEEFRIDFAAVPPKTGFVGESAQVSTSSSSALTTTAPSSSVVMSPVVAANATPRVPSVGAFPGAAPTTEAKRRHASSGSTSSQIPHPQTPQLSPYFAHGGNGYFPAPALSQYPTMINQEIHAARPMGLPATFDGGFVHPVSPAVSPLPQNTAFMRSPSHSPPMAGFQYPPFAPMEAMQAHQRPSPEYDGYAGDDAKGGERQRCPHPDCGKTYKDIKAHMLTHQLERPEKCPIQSCEYHTKGFSRKYDRNRHTLTHYKGNMVCGFCPGSGSSVEKSFNRADVFKRHLTAVHNVEQTPPNSRRKGGPNAGAAKKLSGYAADATGKCSTCSQTFSNAQDFYEHLDDCVLRIVQLEDPAEAINAQRLAEVEHDRDVHATLEKNQLPIKTEMVSTEDDDDVAGDDDDDMVEDAGEDGESDLEEEGSPSSIKRTITKTGPANGVQKSRGMTHSRRGQSVTGKARGRKGRREYPSSWGYDKGQMTKKKRVLTVFEGPRRLAKDDMLVSTEREVRLQLGDGKSYVTDLDVAIINRAVGFQSATDEEKGLWISDDPTEAQVKEMMEFSARQEAAQTGTPVSNV